MNIDRSSGLSYSKTRKTHQLRVVSGADPLCVTPVSRHGSSSPRGKDVETWEKTGQSSPQLGLAGGRGHLPVVIGTPTCARAFSNHHHCAWGLARYKRKPCFMPVVGICLQSICPDANGSSYVLSIIFWTWTRTGYEVEGLVFISGLEG